MKRAGIAAAVTATALLLAQPGAVRARRWWTDVSYLASAGLKGRETGSPEYVRAANYVAMEFRQAGLKPAGRKGFFQPFDLTVRQLIEGESRLALMHEGMMRERLVLGEDAIVSPRGFRPRTLLTAPAVFTGYGLSAPEAGYDDIAGLDLRGKYAVFVSGGPASLPGALRAHAQSLGERWRALRRAGAVGIIGIPNPKAMDVPWERMAARRLQPAMTFAEPALEETPGLEFTVTVNPARAEKFFAGSGHSFAEIAALAGEGKPLPRFPLAMSFEATVQTNTSRAESENVVGVLEGREPSLKDEYVVLSAHLDHLGTTPDGAVYSGAMDDASGIATLLDVAREIVESDRGTRRSLLFLAVTGEEKGLLGSKYFAAYPTVPARGIVADINLDMFLPIHPLRVLTVLGMEESNLGDEARAAALAYGVRVQPDPEPARNRFIRSDQYSFIRRGIPSLALKFGFEKGSYEEKLQRDWVRQRYHAVSDDLTQPVDLAAAVQFDSIVMTLAERIANTTARPKWNDSSFFRRYAR